MYSRPSSYIDGGFFIGGIWQDYIRKKIYLNGETYQVSLITSADNKEIVLENLLAIKDKQIIKRSTANCTY